MAKSKKQYHNDLNKSFNSLSASVSRQTKSITKKIQEVNATLERYGMNTGRAYRVLQGDLSDRIGHVEEWLSAPWYRKIFRRFGR